MEPSTPKKVHARNSVCRLCGGAYENRHLLRVFSKTGNEKNLASKIKNGCGILITEGDTLSKLIGRKCEGFVSKVNVFKQNSQIMQIKLTKRRFPAEAGKMKNVAHPLHIWSDFIKL